MKIKTLFVLLITPLIAFNLFLPLTVNAEEAKVNFCFCASSLKPTDISEEEKNGPVDLTDTTKFKYGCRADVFVNQCNGKAFLTQNPLLINPDCEKTKTQVECQKLSDNWVAQYQALYKSRQNIEYKKNLGFVGRVTPPCVFKDVLGQNCKDITTLVALIINYGRANLAIIGAFALCYFIYGGFILILSQGNPEKVKKGTDTMLAALVGVFIVFVAYLFIQYLGEAINVKPEFQLLSSPF